MERKKQEQRARQLEAAKVYNRQLVESKENEKQKLLEEEQAISRQYSHDYSQLRSEEERLAKAKVSDGFGVS